MKIQCALLFFLASGLTLTGQTKINADSLQKEIILHFKIYLPEAERYSDLTKFGEVKTSFDKEQTEKELHLFEAVKKSELIHSPTMEVLNLCHNISIHSPKKGNEFLALLNQPLQDQELLVPFYMQIIFAEEFGEQLMLKNLTSTNLNWRRDCAGYLGSFATYESSIPIIEKMLLTITDEELKQDLIGALTFISSKKSIPTIKKIIETTSNDETQSKAIFAYTELTGKNGLTYLEKIKPIGEKSISEQKINIDWVKNKTSVNNEFGVLVRNDVSFVQLFKNNKAPAIVWLEKEGLLDTAKASHPIAFTVVKKNELLKLLIESKGTGLELTKGQLFLSLQQSDIPALLELRKSCVYSPNTFSFGRLSTIGLFIRYLRKTKK